MVESQEDQDMPQGSKAADGKKHILLNAFDMSTIGHLSPGQWKVCDTQTQLQEIDLSLTSCRIRRTSPPPSGT